MLYRSNSFVVQCKCVRILLEDSGSFAMELGLLKRGRMNKMKLMKKMMAMALAGAMVLTGSAIVNDGMVTVEAADSVVPTNSPSISIAKEISEDGTVSITLSWNSETMRTFDYGVLFDETKLEFTNMTMSEEFVEAYQWDGTSGEGGVPVYGEVKQGEDSYITFGGVYYGTEKYDGKVATLNFKKKEGAEGAGIIKVVKDSSTYSSISDMKNATAFKKVDLDSDVMVGDVNGDELIDTDDALEVLKYALGMDVVPEFNEEAAYVTDDDVIDTDDALEILKYALGMSSMIG